MGDSVNQLANDLANDPGQSENKIAIVGRACRVPGARDVTGFWNMLDNECAATQRLSDADLLAAGVARNKLADPNYVKVANILPDMESFDAEFFGFSPKDARILDPQHRHFLETAWEALEDAGHMPDEFNGRIGVFGGCGFQAYFPFNILSNPELVEEHGLFLLRHTGNDKDFLTTRVSYLLDLQGPAVSVQTACSTSLVAVHLGVNSLLNMECDMVLAGGVTIELPHRQGYTYAPNEILSPDGICRAFDDHSNGTLFGSGSTIVALRRLEDALADGDDIKAVILGSAINNDGNQKANYFAPSIDGQVEAIAEAVTLSGVSPNSIDYIEAHGTGTNLGDPIELTALNEVYGEGKRGSVLVGSVKTNIGHLDTAAGGAGLIKVIEAMRHGRIPATLNFNTPNSRFDFEHSPFEVNAESRDWMQQGRPRRAAVNSLGVGGTNAHLIVEEAPSADATVYEDVWRLFPFSTKTKGALLNTAPKWARFLRGGQVPTMADMSFTLKNGRRSFDHRMVVAARSHEDFLRTLEGGSPGFMTNAEVGAEPPEVVFVFAGGGAQYPAAAKDLVEHCPVFEEAVNACFSALPSDAPVDLREMMFERDISDDIARRKLNATPYALPALFILEYAYAKLLQSWGIKPNAILAHSVGEYAGAVVAGALTMEDAIKIVVRRSIVMAAAPKGAMVAIPASSDEVLEMVGDGLDIAAFNAPMMSVVSGPVNAIEELEAALRGTAFEASRVQVDVAAHSRLLDSQLENFRQQIQPFGFSRPVIPFVSALRGDWGQEDDFASADYWVRHLRGTVRFVDAANKVLERPNCIIVEVGPGQTLGPLIEMMEARHKPKAVLHCGRRPKEEGDDVGVAMTALGGLWANGVKIDWGLLPGSEGRRVSVPTYAFEKQIHWIEPGQGSQREHVQQEPGGDSNVIPGRIKDIDDWFGQRDWQPIPPGLNDDASLDNILVLAGRDPVSKAVVGALSDSQANVTVAYRGAQYAAHGREFTLAASAASDFDLMFDALGTVPEHILFLWALDQGDTPEIFDGAYHLMRGIQLADPSNCVSVVMVGVEACDVQGTPVSHPCHSLLMGAVRVAPREIPGLCAKYVDIGAHMDAVSLADKLIKELAIRDGFDRVSWSTNTRLAEVHVAKRMVEAATHRLRQGGTYLIVGGQTGIGRELAIWMAEHFRANIAILSRSAHLDEPLVQVVNEFAGEVRFYPGDATSIDDLRKAKSQIESEFGVVHGVFHGAGVINDAPLSAKDLECARDVLAPKVEGALNLGAIFPDGTLDIFAVFSSASVMLGPPGQTDYVAANAFLESFAATREDGLVIAWGIWRDIGMAAVNYSVPVESEPLPFLGPRCDEDGHIFFERGVDPKTEWLLSGHIVNGQKVLPGVAYIDLIERAGREALGQKPFEICSLSLASPLVFHNDLPRKVGIKLIPLLKGFEVVVQSKSGMDSAHWEEHARASIVVSKDTDHLQPARLGALPNGAPLETRTICAQSNLIEFGKRWDNVVEIEIFENQAVGHYALAPGFLEDVNQWRIHPGLLDTAATVGLDLLSEDERRGMVYAPISVERIRVMAPIPTSIQSRACRLDFDGNRLATFDIEILDEQGSPLVYLEGFAMCGIEDDKFGMVGGELSRTEAMLAQGISKADAPALFERIFSAQERNIVVSSLPLELIRLSLVQARTPTSNSVNDSGSVLTRFEDKEEEWLASLWVDLLGAENLTRESDFFRLGGHSLNAVRMFSRIRKKYDIELPLATLFEAPTLGQLAELIRERSRLSSPQKSGSSSPSLVCSAQWSPLVKIKCGEPNKTPFFCIHGAGGNVLNFRSLSGYMRHDIPFIGVRSLGSDGGVEIDETIEDMATRYLEAVREYQPMGPYWLGGYSGGGLVAYEMTQRLQAEGEVVEHLVFFDTLAAHIGNRKLNLLEKIWAARNWDLGYALEWLGRKHGARSAKNDRDEILRLLAENNALPRELIGRRMSDAFVRAQARYEAKSYAGDIVIFKAKRASTQFIAGGKTLGWDELVSGKIEVHEFDCDHFTMMSDPTIARIGDLINNML